MKARSAIAILGGVTLLVLELSAPGSLRDAYVLGGIFSHPGAALVVGPVLVGGPYAVARALSNRFARACGKGG
jgi:hypothetical protein